MIFYEDIHVLIELWKGTANQKGGNKERAVEVWMPPNVDAGNGSQHVEIDHNASGCMS